MVIDTSETSSGRSWSLYGVTRSHYWRVRGEGSFSDRKSLLGYETWRLAPHRRVTHCSASSNSAINTRMVQGHEIINDFLHGMYSVLISRRKSVKSMNLNTTNSSVSEYTSWTGVRLNEFPLFDSIAAPLGSRGQGQPQEIQGIVKYLESHSVL